MAKVEGYYYVDKEDESKNIFLGQIQIPGHNALAVRYMEGMCWGEYDTDTEHFTPHTNPMRIPEHHVHYVDERVMPNGQIQVDYNAAGENQGTVGLIEDHGADFARKPVFNMSPKPSPAPKTKTKTKTEIDLDRLFII